MLLLVLQVFFGVLQIWFSETCRNPVLLTQTMDIHLILVYSSSTIKISYGFWLPEKKLEYQKYFWPKCITKNDSTMWPLCPEMETGIDVANVAKHKTVIRMTIQQYNVIFSSSCMRNRNGPKIDPCRTPLSEAWIWK